MFRTALRVAVVPTFAESVTDAGLTASTGWYTVSVTEMMKGLPFAPVALIVSCAVYVPAGLAPGVMVSARLEGAEPLAGLSNDTQLLSFVAIQLSGPVPLFEMWRVSWKMRPLFAFAEWLMVAGPTTSTGCWITNVTIVVSGEPGGAPVAVTTTVSS